MTSIKSSAIAALLFAAGLQITAVPSHAQVSAASINGAARDASGAVVPTATVLLRNVETGVETRTMTNEQGVYVIQSILPGNYILEAGKEGFATSRQGPVTLVVNQRS